MLHMCALKQHNEIDSSRHTEWARQMNLICLHHQVVREVAVLDNINPGGMYASRVKMLGRYKPFLVPTTVLSLSSRGR